MDSYHHQQYNNIVYNNSSNLGSQLPPTDELLLQNSQSAKDVQYNTTSESIIASNITTNVQHVSYQQNQSQPMVIQQQQIENIQTSESFNQYIQPNQQEYQANTSIPTENPTFKTEQFKTETDYCESIEENEATHSVVLSVNENIQTIENGAQTISTPLNVECDRDVADSVTTPSMNVETNTNTEPESNKAKENEIDPNQCRVCLDKENLVNIFTSENNSRICDLITNICTTVKIVVNDYLPHYICANCLEKVKIASEFKAACETTDRELRKKLKRGKNKIRSGNSRYLLVDCELSSDSDVADQKNEDDEFKLSDAVVDSDSDASFTLEKKKKKSSHKSKKKSHHKKTDIGEATTKSFKNKSKSIRTSNRIQPPQVTIPIDVVYVEAARLVNRETAANKNDDDDDDSDSAPLSSRRSKRSSQNIKSKSSKKTSKSKPPGPKSATISLSSSSSSKVPHKKRKHVSTAEISSDETASKKSSGSTPSSAQRERKERPCDLCDLVFTSWQSLKDHRKAHKGEKPLVCHICNRPFKQRVSLDAHVRKHMEDETRMCKQCNNKQFASRLELRKHQQTVHEAEFTFECDKCKRIFTSEARLNTHKDGKCPGFDTSQRKKPEVEVSANLGRDLFKCVAPVTSTYWSDDFSE